LLEVIQNKIFRKGTLPTENNFFTQPIVEKYFWYFMAGIIFKSFFGKETMPAHILIRYPQFVPIVIYTIFAASFQI